jgi:hypothetical protein
MPSKATTRTTREPSVGQRDLVGRRLVLADGHVETKYTLPFVDPRWRVPFVVFDRLGGPPRILRATVRSEGRTLHTTASIRDLHPIETIPTSDFTSLVHFDPWWAFRGISGVDRSSITAILPTNIARPFRRGNRTWKIHDLRFGDGMERLEAIIAKDESFHARTFGPTDLDPMDLRRSPPSPRIETDSTRSAKAL